ncbi:MULTISPECIES: hypothetical protein [Acidianus]|uniref:2-polyprenylphenol hydroxylase n=1 Tax=Candidatus Acidianus copahuensis TaxID=1160895 RepID=A0A031LPU8_9CREN|nr:MULTISPECIES: hypothetical protein [Acidianus]EZQ04828.1 2-polyprenylphenol hydroxylase [Candidatus Acidianus copahuensis]NON62784.1 2-polyprenylphenol hydroxylase [Acidianus sp. RZ1]
MKYANVIRAERGDPSEIDLEVEINTLPGQFLTIIIPPYEIPMGIGDAKNGLLTIFVESPKLFDLISRKDRVIVKGPLGRPIKLGNSVLGITDKMHYHDLIYPLRTAIRRGSKVGLVCNDCPEEFEKTEHLDGWDTILASVPREKLKELPSNSLVFVRWTKMNCMMGVCGVCEVNGYLPCIEGPFMQVSHIVDKR